MTPHPRRREGLLRAALAALLACLIAIGLTACGGGDDGDDRLLIGVQDDRLADTSESPAERMALVGEVDAQIVRVDLRWDLVAGSGRAPRDARDPEDSAYDWRQYDAVVAEANRRGVQVLFSIWGTPSWAVDPTVAPHERYRSWTTRPRRPEALGDFAVAAATRYRPLGVHMWEVWNEPNIPLFLRPQYERRGGRWVPASPRVYVRMVRAMVAGVRSVDPEAKVGIGVTAPNGDTFDRCAGREADCRISPLEFLRMVTEAAGDEPLPMDAWSHHPYPLTKPREASASNINTVDLYNLDWLEQALDQYGHRDAPLWLTEFGFLTRSVDDYRFFVAEAQQAEFLTDAVARVRRNPRVEVFIWYFLQDNTNWASGLLRRNGDEKPSADAFRNAARR